MEAQALMDVLMTDRTIFISREFSQFPGPRYEVHGPDSGELFRINILSPALTKAMEDSSIVTVVLDEVAGYGSSFLDEAFAGLLRNGFSYENVMSHLRYRGAYQSFSTP